jgi:hypothetical protein
MFVFFFLFVQYTDTAALLPHLQLCLARRTVLERQSGGVEAMRDSAAALLAAVDALSLVDSAWQWLEVC